MGITQAEHISSIHAGCAAAYQGADEYILCTYLCTNVRDRYALYFIPPFSCLVSCVLLSHTFNIKGDLSNPSQITITWIVILSLIIP